jgi:hypothetical protein
MLRRVGLSLLVALPLQGYAASRIPCADTAPRQIEHAWQGGVHDSIVARPRGRSDVPHFGVGANPGDLVAAQASGDAVPGSCAYCAICCVGAAFVDWAAHLAAARPGPTDPWSQAPADCPQPFDGPEPAQRTF